MTMTQKRLDEILEGSARSRLIGLLYHKKLDVSDIRLVEIYTEKIILAKKSKKTRVYSL